jgi:hypothetical protein
MATAFGAPAAQSLPNAPRWKGLATRATRRFISACVGRKTIHRGRLCFIRPVTPAVRDVVGRAVVCERWCTTALMQSCAWAGLRRE